MLHTIKKVEYLDSYRLKLHFDDRKIKVVNLENMLKKAKNMLLPLTKLDYFRLVKCDGVTIYWPTGVDLCPDMLYKMGDEITQSSRKRKSQRSEKVLRKRSSRA